MSPERRNELLADRAIWGLESAESRELSTIGDSDDLSFDVAAAAAAIAMLDIHEIEQPPAHLLEKLEADAQAQFDLGSGHGSDSSEPTPSSPPDNASHPGWLGWAVAAAAILASVWLGWDRLRPATSNKELRTQLLATHGATVEQLEWNAGPSDRRGDPRGDVVWDDVAQEGYMTFRGLPKNDPEKFQYQLWIFDGKRDLKKPVDGGVFDIAASGRETIVRIDPKIRVHDGVAFAVTIEAPGGVVVSDRDHIVVTAGL